MRIMILLMLQFGITGAYAQSPSGQDLLTACTSALENGFNNEHGMVCSWYVMPCDCESTKAEPETVIPRVCLPHILTETDLAELVLKELRMRTDLLDKSAELAANTILSSYYPCAE